ncbi:MAG TPA: amidohydrolase family protein [Sphingobacteriaceae bacterium]
MSKEINRRTFLKGTGLSAAGIVIANTGLSQAIGQPLQISGSLRYRIMDEVMKFRKIDAYANAYSNNIKLAKSQIEYADKLGIDKLFISVPIAYKMGKTPDEFRDYNNQVLKAMKQYPDRLIGQVTIHPAYPKESLEEIKRCIDQGMVGMKLYNQVKINDPLFYPVIEKYIDYNMIIHVHGESQLGVGGYRMKYDVKNTPTISVPEEFVDIAKRYPEAMFQYAHIGGGSDWEYACKAFRNYRNIYVDTGGSNNEEGMIDFAVETLGEDRVFFGCDSSYFQGVGKVLASALTDIQKKKVFFDNYNAVLKKSGRGF